MCLRTSNRVATSVNTAEVRDLASSNASLKRAEIWGRGRPRGHTPGGRKGDWGPLTWCSSSAACALACTSATTERAAAVSSDTLATLNWDAVVTAEVA